MTKPNPIEEILTEMRQKLSLSSAIPYRYGDDPVGDNIQKHAITLLTAELQKARIEGMEQAQSRVLRRTEIPADAKEPTRDATVILGEIIAEIIQRDIDELKALQGDK